MRNSNILFAAILFAILTLISCQKNELTELTTRTKTTLSLRAIPSAGIHTINEPATTQKKGQLESRTSDFTFISCNAGTFHGNTEGEGSFLDYDNSPYLQKDLEDFKGQNKVYYFAVEDEPEAITTHHITLKNMQDDLDLFVYSITAEGYIADCKAQSMTIGVVNETIELTDLDAGYYYIVVNAWKEIINSSFEIEFYSTSIGVNPVSATLVENIHSISYEENTGVKRGNLFQIIGTDTWYAASQFVSDPSIIRAHIEFKELGRTKTSIFLENIASGGQMYLDLATNKVMEVVNSEISNDIAKITFSSEATYKNKLDN